MIQVTIYIIGGAIEHIETHLNGRGVLMVRHSNLRDQCECLSFSKTPRLGRKIIIVSFEEISEEVCRMRIDMYFLLMMLGPCFMTHQFNLYTKITKKWPSPQKEVV